MKIIFCKECGAKVILTSEYQIRGRMDKCKPCQIKWLADRAIVVIEETGAPVDPGACPDLSISSIEVESTRGGALSICVASDKEVIGSIELKLRGILQCRQQK